MTANLIAGSAVKIAGRAVLFVGKSGSGKSSNSLALIGLGAQLISDDQCAAEKLGDQILLSAPASIRGQIEARGVGILNAKSSTGALGLVVDLDTPETDRLPPVRSITILGCEIDLILGAQNANLVSVVNHLMRHGRANSEPTNK